MTTPRPVRQPRRLATALSIACVLALAVFVALSLIPRPERTLRLTAGSFHTSRERFVEVLAAETGALLVPTASVVDSLEAAASGAVDVALVSGAMGFERWPRLRQVAPLYVEPLHLLVKEELIAEATSAADLLRGRTIRTGPKVTLVHWLATDLLAFLGLTAAWHPLALPGDEEPAADARAQALLASPRDALPDALFSLGALPSTDARALFGPLRYRLVPLPFADAFSLPRFVDPRVARQTAEDQPLVVQREFVYDAVIPAFAYQVDPAVPPEKVHTLGSRLLLVARDDVDAGSIEHLLERVFHTRIARSLHPPLTPQLLSLPHEIPAHPGTLAFLHRNRPLITGASADLLGNVVSIAGALVAGWLFLWQGLRGWRRQRRHRIFDEYIRRVAAIERRAAELELAAELQLEPLRTLQHDLTRVRGEAVERFLAGEVDDRTLLSELLAYASGCRDVLAHLILHARDDLEESRAGSTAAETRAAERPCGEGTP